MPTESKVAVISTAPPTIEITPEVIAFARAVVALVDGPATRREPRLLFNVRTGVIHNPRCGHASGCRPMTKDQIYAVVDEPWGCNRCGSFMRETPFDRIEVPA